MNRIWLFPFLLVALIGLAVVLARWLNISEGVTVLVASLALILIVLLSGTLVDIRNKRREQRVRQLALSRGLEIEEKTRHVTSYDTDPKYYEEGTWFGYSLRHRFPKTSTWSLLMPESRSGDFPNGWRLVVKEGEVSNSTKELVAEIASEIAQDKSLSKQFLEIKCYPDKAWAYWKETAGLKMAHKVFDILFRISAQAE
jgi:hypothetical protein